MRKLFSVFASNIVFANITIVMFFIIALFSAFSMTKEMFPEMVLDRVYVTVAYPGADPEEVEEGILKKVEEAVEGESGIKEIQSIANENVGTVWITVEPGADSRDVLDRVRSSVDAINTFPVGAENPITRELKFEDPVVILSLTADMTEARMKEWAEDIRIRLLEHEKITVVSVEGAREYEISIEVSEEDLRKHGIGLEQVRTAVRRNNINIPGGTIRGANEEVRLRTLGRKYTGEELAEIVVLSRPSGETVKLGQVATIVDGFEEDELRSSVNGRQAVFLYVKKVGDQDALDISNATLKFVENINKTLPDGAEVGVLLNTTDMLRARISLLIRNGLVGLGIVLLLLWLFLDIRLAFWAGMGMPISIAGALGVLWAIGGSINMISLFGLIMVLGIIVDDAIVVGESIYHRFQQGEDPHSAAVNGVTDVGLPVLGAVATSVVAFIPLMYVGGIMGKFIEILPKVVIACLAVSLIECLLLLPAHLAEMKHRDPKKKTGAFHRVLDKIHDWFGARLTRFIDGPYAWFLDRALRWRYVSLAIAVAILFITLGFIRGGFVGFQLFPRFDSFLITATVEFPDGTPIETTESALDRIERASQQLADEFPTATGGPLILNTVRLAGGSLSENVTATGHKVGSIQLVLVDTEQRNASSEVIMKRWEELIGQIPGSDALTIGGMNAGLPGKPIDVGIRGRDLASMDAAAQDLMQRLTTFQGVGQIQTDFRPGKNEYKFRLKEEAVQNGLTVEDLGLQLSQAYYGGEALRIQRNRDDIRIMIRNTDDERSRISDLKNVRIRTPGGDEMPLLSVADMSTGPGYSSITRIDGLRTVSVSAEVDPTQGKAGEINSELESKHFPELQQRYPDVYFDFQGEKQDSGESVSSLLISFPIAMIGIYIIIAAIFRSYIQPLVIMFTIPFGIIGAVIGHIFMGIELSLMSMFGMVALAGVVVNDAIVLIEAINHNVKEGIPLFKAIILAGQRRFRAVFLTTLSTVGGLMPLILETDLQAQFLIPMALSIAAGVAFATLLTLLLIPNTIAVLSDLRCLMYYAWNLKWPETRNQLEPASKRIEREVTP